jgi:hypothetical protein
MLLLLLLLLQAAAACHPMCRYQCDDPVFPAQTRAECAPARCTLQNCSALCQLPEQTCVVVVNPESTCEMDSCPQAEIICPNPERICLNATGCQFLCEAPDCRWVAWMPKDRPVPRCEPMCEQVACAAATTALPATVELPSSSNSGFMKATLFFVFGV